MLAYVHQTKRPKVYLSSDDLRSLGEGYGDPRFPKKLSCPTVIRQTLVPKLNMGNVEGYAKLAKRAKPTYIEPKGAMSVGFASRDSHTRRWRATRTSRGSHPNLAETGYNIIDEQYESNIVLLSRLEEADKTLRLKVLNQAPRREINDFQDRHQDPRPPTRRVQ